MVERGQKARKKKSISAPTSSSYGNNDDNIYYLCCVDWQEETDIICDIEYCQLGYHNGIYNQLKRQIVQNIVVIHIYKKHESLCTGQLQLICQKMKVMTSLNILYNRVFCDRYVLTFFSN